MSLFLEDLNNTLDEVSEMHHEHFDRIESIVNQIVNLKNQQKEKDKELIASIDKMCAELSTEVRLLQPNLVVSIKTNCCEIGYRTKCITCRVKPYDGCWDFGSSDFGMLFSKRYPECRQLNCSLSDLARSLVEFFTNTYRSLS
jgi:hypothetical protein